MHVIEAMCGRRVLMAPDAHSWRVASWEHVLAADAVCNCARRAAYAFLGVFQCGLGLWRSAGPLLPLGPPWGIAWRALRRVRLATTPL